MEKVKLAPINHHNYESNLQEITKKELEEAGVVIDYIDEIFGTNKEKQKDNQKKKKWNFKNYKRWILLAILMFFVAIIIKMGMTHITYEEAAENNVQASSTSPIINEVVDEKEQFFKYLGG